jgi:hypothetical protein
MTFDHVYNEPDSWNVCKMHKGACSPGCIDDLIKSFKEPDS